MDKYNIKLSKIFRGLFCLLLCGIILWFTYECYLIFLPFADKLSFRSIGGNYIEGRVTELKRNSDGVVQMVAAEYQVGFRKETADLPAHLWYHEGIEEGDRIAVPFHHKSFEDMRREDKIMLYALLSAGAIFLIRGLVLIIGELSKSHYYQDLIANKKYITARVTDITDFGKKAYAVCSYGECSFDSDFYRIDEFPFKINQEVKIYVDLEKNPEKYYVSQR